MIMTVAEFRQMVATDETDQALEIKLQGLELLIRTYTNNNFQLRAFRIACDAVSDGNQLVIASKVPFKVCDTIQITDSAYQMNQLLTVESVNETSVTVKEDILDESEITVTKVHYPADVKIGVAYMLKWDLENRDKVGIASETISRHSVSYFNMDQGNSTVGYPTSLVGFLKPYKKARFGQGLIV